MANKAGPKFRFLCFGVGAVGIYLGGSLVKIGHHVTFIDRPENAEEVRKKGLHLTINNHVHDIENPDVIPTIEEALTHGPFDAAIFAVKGYDTDHVLKYLLPYQVALPPFICIQDGIGNEARLVNVLGPDKVIPAVLTTTVRKTGLGSAAVIHERGIGMSGSHQLTAAIIDAFNQTGMRVRRYRDATSMKWSKLLFSLMTNASAAILQMTPEEIIR
ncbi:MAG: 2-dehydropantoate 2-reductase, partial [Anaerolineaceae bacterium]|nr:2-dehydropantoate 2-reductase [Anaerolineaceae bacterium]